MLVIFAVQGVLYGYFDVFSSGVNTLSAREPNYPVCARSSTHASRSIHQVTSALDRNFPESDTTRAVGNTARAETDAVQIRSFRLLRLLHHRECMIVVPWIIDSATLSKFTPSLGIPFGERRTSATSSISAGLPLTSNDSIRLVH